MAEFTPHQREVFCVFSGQGVIGLRRYLNNEARLQRTGRPFDDDDEETLNGEPAGEGDDDDDQTMTGMMGATGLNGVPSPAEDEVPDEELEDVEDNHHVGGHIVHP
jgi:F-box and leucine-rich repeat protein GRR1